MSVFTEKVEDRRDRNRNYRFGGWGGIVVKVLVCLILLWVINGINSDQVVNMFRIVGVSM
jgi:hypothetical protein